MHTSDWFKLAYPHPHQTPFQNFWIPPLQQHMHIFNSFKLVYPLLPPPFPKFLDQSRKQYMHTFDSFKLAYPPPLLFPPFPKFLDTHLTTVYVYIWFFQTSLPPISPPPPFQNFWKRPRQHYMHTFDLFKLGHYEHTQDHTASRLLGEYCVLALTVRLDEARCVDEYIPKHL